MQDGAKGGADGGGHGVALPTGILRGAHRRVHPAAGRVPRYLRRAGLQFTEPEGAYYVLADIGEFGHADDMAFCHWLEGNRRGGGAGFQLFFAEPVRHLIRFHFAKKEETLHAAGERLLQLHQKA